MISVQAHPFVSSSLQGTTGEVSSPDGDMLIAQAALESGQAALASEKFYAAALAFVEQAVSSANVDYLDSAEVAWKGLKACVNRLTGAEKEKAHSYQVEVSDLIHDTLGYFDKAAQGDSTVGKQPAQGNSTDGKQPAQGVSAEGQQPAQPDKKLVLWGGAAAIALWLLLRGKEGTNG